MKSNKRRKAFSTNNVSQIYSQKSSLAFSTILRHIISILSRVLLSQQLVHSLLIRHYHHQLNQLRIIKAAERIKIIIFQNFNKIDFFSSFLLSFFSSSLISSFFISSLPLVISNFSPSQDLPSTSRLKSSYIINSSEIWSIYQINCIWKSFNEAQVSSLSLPEKV